MTQFSVGQRNKNVKSDEANQPKCGGTEPSQLKCEVALSLVNTLILKKKKNPIDLNRSSKGER